MDWRMHGIRAKFKPGAKGDRIQFVCCGFGFRGLAVNITVAAMLFLRWIGDCRLRGADLVFGCGGTVF